MHEDEALKQTLAQFAHPEAEDAPNSGADDGDEGAAAGGDAPADAGAPGADADRDEGAVVEAEAAVWLGLLQLSQLAPRHWKRHEHRRRRQLGRWYWK